MLFSYIRDGLTPTGASGMLCPDRLAVVSVCARAHPTGELTVSRAQPARLAFPYPGRREEQTVSFCGGNAYQLVLFQVAFGAFLIDVLMSCELRGDLIIRSETGLDILSRP
jgi:hypothetical protein